MSLNTYVSQNLGAGKNDRVKQGAKFGIITSLIIAETVGVLFYFFGANLVGLFSDDSAVIAAGALHSTIASMFFFLLSFSHTAAAVLRGAGKATIPMIVMLVCWCLIRVSYIRIIMNTVNKIEFVFWAYPLTWFLSSIIFLIYLWTSNWNRSVSNPEII